MGGEEEGGQKSGQCMANALPGTLHTASKFTHSGTCAGSSEETDEGNGVWVTGTHRHRSGNTGTTKWGQ